MKTLRFAVLAVFIFTVFVQGQESNAPAVGPFKVLHSFSVQDGASPNSLIQTQDGTFYGSAANGGDTGKCSEGCGTLFKVDGLGKYSILHKFQATDGYLPTGLTLGADGNFYGTTMAGGQPSGGGAGVLFRMNSSGGNFTILYAFTGGFACCDGAGPVARPVQASDGNFYGTTGAGGAFRDIDHQGGFGTIYRFNPNTSDLTILHSFDINDGNGIFPNGPLVQAADGALYGTTREGAAAFKIDLAGNFSPVTTLSGTQPLSGLIQAKDGNFYGTDEGGSGGGSVYRIDASNNVTFVNIFDGADGWKPNFRIFQAADGFFYGSTPEGGMLDFQGGGIFRLSTTGVLRVLHSFLTSGPEGFAPNSELIQGVDGALYGVTGIGGTAGRGTLFRLDQRVIGPIGSISVSPGVIHSGQTSTGTVTLSRPAPAGGTKVTLGALQGQIVIPASVTVPSGAKTATFTINTLNILASAKVRIYASIGGQAVRTVITVLPK